MQQINYLLILLLVTDLSTQLTNADCKNVSCPKGQECRFVSNAEGEEHTSRKKECSCIIHCPWKSRRRHKRICGSDGFSYESECHLYRYACRSDQEIFPLYKNKTCLKSPFIKLKKIINQAVKEIKLFEKEEKKSLDTIQVPVACNQNERNNMREFIIDYVTKRGQRNLKGMSYHRLLSRSFTDMDTDNDTNVDSIELFNYVHKKTETKRATPTAHNDIIIELERQESFGGTLVIDSRVDERFTKVWEDRKPWQNFCNFEMGLRCAAIKTYQRKG
ncbi:follistatin-related protein 1 isoform X2 [Lepeophtheirus salmonis]|uniref:follistatin-related protein 1 isoform X2 n=1 Tax=Lepeophtheirus salmonis TaxID=72036 RepID=UPI003AF3FC4A